jgi:chromosomal replication initiation ATPase DnaA
MPRQARIDIPGHAYHVMARGIERRRVFIDQRDYEDFLSRLEKALEISKISPEELVKQVIMGTNIRPEDIFSRSQVRQVVKARAL